MLNAAFMQGYIPDSWNVNLTTPIYKRGDASDPANYRPIAVGAPIMRLMAVIINRRVMDFTETQGLKSPIQAAISDRKCHAAISCWHCSIS